MCLSLALNYKRHIPFRNPPLFSSHLTPCTVRNPIQYKQTTFNPKTAKDIHIQKALLGHRGEQHRPQLARWCQKGCFIENRYTLQT